MLGVITEVSLKVVPKFKLETTLQFTLAEAAALRQLNAWGALPLPISASAWHMDRLRLRLSGSGPAVAAAAAKLGGEAAELATGAQFWQALR